MGIVVSKSMISVGGTLVSATVPLPRITVSGKNFMRRGRPYKFWGWHTEVNGVSGPLDFLDSSRLQLFQEDVRLKARMQTNIMRIFVQMFDFVSGPNTAGLVFNQTALANLVGWLDAARNSGMYIKLCGGNVWIPADAPAWYDAFTNFEDRWDVQEFFYTNLVKGIVAAGHDSTIMGYDLTGEPVVKLDPAYPWYGEESYPGNPTVSGQYYNPCIARGELATDQAARNWIKQLTAAIKKVDPLALCTVGTLPFVGGAFGRDNTQDLLDFVSPHIYPGSIPDISGMLPVEQAQGWAASTKPVICGEYYSLALAENNEDLMAEVAASFNGVISWGDGRFPEEIIIDPSLDFYSRLLLALNIYNVQLLISFREDFLIENL